MIKISAYKINFKLREPISISFHTWYYRENVLVKLKYKNFEGLGEAAPFKPITGDSQKEVIEEIKLINYLPLDPNEDGLDKLHNFLEKKEIKSQTLKAAIDFAYHDLLGKIKNVPVFNLYDKKAKYVFNSVTVFIKESINQTEDEVKKIYKKYPHLKILKIKLKGDVKDINIAKVVKKNSPSYIKFILDANQGYNDPKKAIKSIMSIEKILENVILVEQPCPKNDLEKLKFVKDKLDNILVFADESAATLKDVKKVISYKAADGVNIKLQKAGGIWPAKKIAQLCINNNLKIMVGSMLEGPISINAGVHFAASTKNVLLTDLDMDLDMPFHVKGKAVFKKGKRMLYNISGLGVSLIESKLKKLISKGDLIIKKII
jgi:L-alanine-DL-glutamate epimerase-like enolase superfamily enzyme